MRLLSKDIGRIRNQRIMVIGHGNCQVKWKNFRTNATILKENGL